MKKIIYFIVFSLISLYGIKTVKAEDQYVFYKVDAHYQSRVENHPEFTRDLRILEVDEKPAFSLNVEQALRQVLAEEDQEYLSNLTDEQKSFLKRIYQNGYDEENSKIYMAAQEIIWEYMSDYEVYWTDYNGNEIDLENEKNEIINAHIKQSSFPNINSDINGNYYEEIIIEDDDLIGCKINNKTSNVIKIIENNLKIKLKDSGTFTISKQIENENPKIYHPLNSPYLIIFTDEQLTKSYNINVNNDKNAFIELQFTYNNKPIDGIVKFELDGKIYETNKLGYFLSTNTFKLENKKVKILSLPLKYQLKEEEFNIELIEKNINENQIIKLKKELEPKKGTIKISRIGITRKLEEKLSNIEYALYAKEDILLDNVLIYKKGTKVIESLTNDVGYLVLDNLFLGKYELKEITKTKYIESDNIDITLTEDKNIYENIIKTFHKPLNIKIESDQNVEYYLYDSNDNIIQKLNNDNTLYIEYGTYKIVVKKDDKILQRIDIIFQNQSAYYNLYLTYKDDIILFEMPKTGRIFRYDKFIQLEKNKYEF